MAKRLTKKEKSAVAIASDVIKQINSRKFAATRGTYVRFSEEKHIPRDVELQTAIKTAVTEDNPCNVCALGAAFVSSVRLFDNFKTSDSNMSGGQPKLSRIKEHLGGFFEEEEVRQIELCFELEPDYIGIGGRSHRERLVSVCQPARRERRAHQSVGGVS